MRCVLVSKSLDLSGYLGPQFMRAADRIEIVSHPHAGAGDGRPAGGGLASAG